MKLLGTERCIVCGAPTKFWTGHVKAVQKIDGKREKVKITAGFCNNICYYTVIGKSNKGCFGDYNFDMGLMKI
jgi:hypothetical protein